jgi:hypothetical protein
MHIFEIVIFTFIFTEFGIFFCILLKNIYKSNKEGTDRINLFFLSLLDLFHPLDLSIDSI